MSTYILAPQVHLDLVDIWGHIAQDNPDAADKVLDSLEKAFIKLAQMPGMGHRRQDLASEALRFWPVSHFLAIYRTETEPVEIVRIIDGYRDIASLLIGQ